LWLKHDAWRFMAPGAPRLLGKDAVAYFWPQDQHNAANQGRDENHLETEAERELLWQLKGELAALKADIRFERLLRALKAYNPNQPRVARVTRECSRPLLSRANVRSPQMRA
jgi:hypothetical protein